ncbi:hypothetical protein V6N11_021166 [Hibiscus sabdariffa]|uniref:Uncharacterized protein n=1 Tax=Hibiscus sabdariffa TaxID=183260 RepID=A0ABR2A5E9_9ROSI
MRFFVCCAYGVALVIRPSQRLSCGKGLAAVTDVYFQQSPKTATVGSHPWRTRPLSGCLRPTLGLLGAVSTAWFVLPPQAALAATVGSNPRALLVLNSPCLCLSSWLLDSPLCGTGLALLALSSLCLCLALWLPDGPLFNAGFMARLRVRFAACFVEWMTSERFGSMAWPRYRFMTCSASMADSLLAKLGDLTFTTEEQDAVVVAPETVAIPAEDFESSLVGKSGLPSYC